MFEVALNAVTHSATGISPHCALFGQEARVPSTFLDEELRRGLPKGSEYEIPVSIKLRKWFP